MSGALSSGERHVQSKKLKLTQPPRHTPAPSVLAPVRVLDFMANAISRELVPLKSGRRCLSLTERAGEQSPAPSAFYEYGEIDD